MQIVQHCLKELLFYAQFLEKLILRKINYPVEPMTNANISIHYYQ